MIDDRVFAQQLASHHFDNRKSGSWAVASALAAKGVSRAVSDEVLEGASLQDEERAYELAESKAIRMSALPPEKAYSRLVGLLARRGYGPGIARNAARKALDVQRYADQP